MLLKSYHHCPKRSSVHPRIASIGIHSPASVSILPEKCPIIWCTSDLKLDVSSGELEEIISIKKYDCFKPAEDMEGNLYF